MKTKLDRLTGNDSLRAYPKYDHRSNNYKGLASEYPSLLFSTLERHLPLDLLNVSRDVKFKYMSDVLRQYSTDDGRMEKLEHQKKRQNIASHYKPLYRKLYTMNASEICVPSFIHAFSPCNPNRGEQSTRDIMSHPGPGVVAFDMLQPRFCEMLLSEVENFEKWANDTKFKMTPPNKQNKYGVVLDDFGLEGTLSKLVMDFVRHISKVYFPDVGGFDLDSHHGLLVEYGVDRDVESGFQVDDSEVTLNVCLGKQFTGGDLIFRGVRCEKHMNGQTYSDEYFDYSHSLGHAIIHHGRHRHGARATTNGNRSNLLLWCRSSMFREVNKHMKDDFKFCRECKKEKGARLVHDVAACQQAVLVSDGGVPAKGISSNADYSLRLQPNQDHRADNDKDPLKVYYRKRKRVTTANMEQLNSNFWELDESTWSK